VSRVDELAKLEKSIKEAEVRLRAIQINMDAMDVEIRKISAIECTLIENVKILKAQQIIALAQEYKKAKEELRRVQLRLVVFRNDKEQLNKALSDVNNYLQVQRFHIQKILKEGENNVLKFRRRDGKK
jgi:predicted  nucleic acid-binding Zn-ribbon protein